MRELQIQLDDVLSCPGSCPGCSLTTDERKNSDVSDMSDDIRAVILRQLETYIKSQDSLDRVNLTFGIADHLMMSKEYVAKICMEAGEMLSRCGYHQPDNGVFFTTSIILKKNILEDKLSYIADACKYVCRVVPIVVLDPAKLYHDSYGAEYKASILRAKEIFGQIDLAINLSTEAVNRLSANTFAKFARDNGFNEVTVNLTPTMLNAKDTLGNMDIIKRWLIDFDFEADKAGDFEFSYGPVMSKAITIGAQVSNAFDVNLLKQTIYRSLEFDHLGNVFPKMEGVGDVAHSERFGFKPMGNVRDSDLLSILNNGMNAVIKKIHLLHGGTAACMKCDYLNACIVTGNHVYTNVMRKSSLKTDGDKCPHIAKTLLEYYTNKGRWANS